MTIPILNQASSVKCVVCGGYLYEGHKHVYIDQATLDFYDTLSVEMLKTGCVLVNPENGDVLWGHPLLKEGYRWFPVKVTNIGPHDECAIPISHHHCKSEAMELWDTDSGNLIGQYATLNDLIQAACRWGQANLALDATLLGAK